jgi:hypothetical protein
MIRVYNTEHDVSIVMPTSLEQDLAKFTNSHLFRVKAGQPVQMASIAFNEQFEKMYELLVAEATKYSLASERRAVHEVIVRLLEFIDDFRNAMISHNVGTFDIIGWERA